MNHFSYIILIVGLLLFAACRGVESKNEVHNVDNLLSARYEKMLAYPVDSLSFPRSYDIGGASLRKTSRTGWTSGFFPGSLWYLRRLTENDKYLSNAQKWTQYLENEKYNNRTHDMGFKIFCSYGNGYKATKNEDYKSIILKSANTLSTRFNENIGSIRSWDSNTDKWKFPVIIDNMMNLELLFEATKLSGDSIYHNIAVTHANTTLRNHFRDDASSYHVVDYHPTTGDVTERVTHQGFNDDSAWARGQAWGVYGYTMSYRYTKNPIYLERAESSAIFFINHDKLREDGIPYWDFNDPAIPDAPRDVSAAAIMASALLELTQYTKNEEYEQYAKKVLKTLSSQEYVMDPDITAPFILKHSTGHWPKNDEIDGPITYADYYFLEALVRSK